MIFVYYKPFKALRPLHLALLASLNPPARSSAVAEKLAVSQLIIDNFVDDIVAWNLALSTGKKIALTDRGKRCVDVWNATNKRGFWEFEDIGSGWLLGEGLFSFRKPVKSLADAGLDAETGKLLREDEARKMLQEHQQAVHDLELEIKAASLRQNLLKAFAASKDLAPIIEASVTRARSMFHLNQLCNMTEIVLNEIQQKAPVQTDLLEKMRDWLKELNRKVRPQIQCHEQASQAVTHVLLGLWLTERTGFLKDIAVAEPDALLVKSDFGGSGTSVR